MASTYKSEYYRFNGTDWDLILFKTSADMIVETTTKKVLTSEERARIGFAVVKSTDVFKILLGDESGADYLKLTTDGNSHTELQIKRASDASIRTVWTDANLDLDDYLTRYGGTMAGNLSLASHNILDVGYLETQNIVVTQDVTTSGFYAVGGVANIKANAITIGNDTQTSVVSFNNTRVRSVGTPSDGTDAVNKTYVDSLIATGVHIVESVACATTANINLLTAGLTIIDGVQLVDGSRVLVSFQTEAYQNGIYVAHSTGWSLVSADSGQGSYVFVDAGNTYNNYYFYCQDSNGTWIQSGRPETDVAGAGLTKSGHTFSVASLGITNDMLAGSISHGKLAPFTVNSSTITEGTSFATLNLNSSLDTTSLVARLANIYKAISALRGTSDYASSSYDYSIKTVHDLASGKNTTFIGGDAPSVGAPSAVAGDVYFKTI